MFHLSPNYRIQAVERLLSGSLFSPGWGRMRDNKATAQSQSFCLSLFNIHWRSKSPMLAWQEGMEISSTLPTRKHGKLLHGREQIISRNNTIYYWILITCHIPPLQFDKVIKHQLTIQLNLTNFPKPGTGPTNVEIEYASNSTRCLRNILLFDYGRNSIKPKRKESIWDKFINSQQKDFCILVFKYLTSIIVNKTDNIWGWGLFLTVHIVREL